MKKNIIRGILAGIITFLVLCCISLVIEYRQLDTKYQKLQKSIDDKFLACISDIEIKVAGALEDDEIFESYYMAYEQLHMADSIYHLTSYRDKQVNSSEQESKIDVQTVLKQTKLYIYDRANEKERMDSDMVEFICENLKGIAENMDNAEKCNMYIDALYEKLD